MRRTKTKADKRTRGTPLAPKVKAPTRKSDRALVTNVIDEMSGVAPALRLAPAATVSFDPRVHVGAPHPSFWFDVMQEVRRARAKHPRSMMSGEEAWAIISEELDEFWDEVRAVGDCSQNAAQYRELVQTAAMCLRAAEDLYA